MTKLHIQWSGNRLEFFSSDRLAFKPIQERRDLTSYQTLLQNPIAMKQYLNGQPRDITARAKIWDKRWEIHNFSALAIYLKVDQEPIPLFSLLIFLLFLASFYFLFSAILIKIVRKKKIKICSKNPRNLNKGNIREN
jgi:hypothetical protein